MRTATALLCTLLAPSLAQAAPPATPHARDVSAQVQPDNCKKIVQTLVDFGTRHTLSDTQSPTRGIGAARTWIRDEMRRYSQAADGRLRVDFEEFDVPKGPRVPDGAHIVNVLAVIPGTMKEAAGRAYYVVGHYDSRNGDGMDVKGDAPGANDNASGTAVVMECARVLALHPAESTLVFLATSGEEQSLLGARAHADKMALTKSWLIRGVLNNDIVGDPSAAPLGSAPDPRDRTLVRVFSDGLPRNATAEQVAQIRSLGSEVDSVSRQLARYVAETAAIEGCALTPRVTYRLDRFLRGGDHSCFSDNGFPAVRFSVPKEDYNRQHQDIRREKDAKGVETQFGDIPEFVDAGYVADVARLNATILYNLANAPSVPENARLVTAQLETTTTMRWSSSPEPDVAGYEVVWRETTNPTWDHVKDVGTATEAKLDLCKDDWFFGVRAYDKDGYRSPVAFAGASKE